MIFEGVSNATQYIAIKKCGVAKFRIGIIDQAIPFGYQK